MIAKSCSGRIGLAVERRATWQEVLDDMPRQPCLIQTQRLALRPYTQGDLAGLRAVFADPYAAQFYPAMNQQASLQRWIDWNLQNYATHGFGLWAMEILETGLFIGDAGITFQTPEVERMLEIGWHVHPDFRGRGYATEAGQACLAYGFDRPASQRAVLHRGPGQCRVHARGSARARRPAPLPGQERPHAAVRHNRRRIHRPARFSATRRLPSRRLMGAPARGL